MMRSLTILFFTVALGFACGPWTLLVSGFGMDAALADDDDDDDDDDDGGGRDDDDDDNDSRRDDDDDDDGVVRRSTPRSTTPPPPSTPTPTPPAPAPAPPVSAPDEIVALALSDEDLSALTAQGFEIIEEIAVPGFSSISRRLEIPPSVALAEARQIVRSLPSGQDADFNHYYRSEQSEFEDCRNLECPARITIDWPPMPDRASACGRNVVIGMVDTGINDSHETFAGARLEVRRLSRDDLDLSRAIHGTAVDALLVGDPATRSPGLVPGSRLIAIDAFHRVGGDERADVFTLVEAVGLLVEQEVGVINLSLSGPPNTVLAELINRLVFEENIAVAAAVGNLGPNAGPTYPAAYEPVIAVTAVDRTENVYRRAVRGPHVDLAAPGVDVWTAASISGARPKTGTSFAVPFVTAAVAMLRDARPDLGAAAIQEELRRLAVDAGDPGPDPIFGAGLLSIEGLCGADG